MHHVLIVSGLISEFLTQEQQQARSAVTCMQELLAERALIMCFLYMARCDLSPVRVWHPLSFIVAAI